VDLCYGFRLGEGQQVIISLKGLVPVPETITPEIPFREGMALQHGPHGPVEDKDAFR
jgi:hypothetical protein